MPHGYNGKILHVDLTSLKMKVEEPDELFYRTYLGGGGIASYYLLKDLEPGIDPLSPENVLVFASTVVSGVPLAVGGKYVTPVVAHGVVFVGTDRVQAFSIKP